MSRQLKRYRIKTGAYTGEIVWFYENVDGKMVPDGPLPWDGIAEDRFAVWDITDLELVE